MRKIIPLTPKSATWLIVFDVNQLHSSTKTDVVGLDYSLANKLVDADAAPESLLQAEGVRKEDEPGVGVAQIHPYLSVTSDPEVHLHRHLDDPAVLSVEDQQKWSQITSKKEKLR